jgi:hypothetical protein
MSDFTVTLTTVAWAKADLVVSATTPKEAQEIALAQAIDSPETVDWELDGIDTDARNRMVATTS